MSMADYMTRANTLAAPKHVTVIDANGINHRWYPAAQRGRPNHGFIVVNCFAIYGDNKSGIFLRNSQGTNR